MKEIKLTQGYVAKVDDEDYGWLSQYKWLAHGPDQGGNVYAKTHRNKGGALMHDLVLGTPKGFEADHIDGDTLNNQRSNLRPATHAQNMLNRSRQANNTSGFKGVYWDEHSGKWRAQINMNHKHVNLGRFDDPKKAARAYNEAALRLHGEFARLNEGI